MWWFWKRKPKKTKARNFPEGLTSIKDIPITVCITARSRCSFTADFLCHKIGDSDWVYEELPYQCTIYTPRYTSNLDIAAFLHEMGHLVHNHTFPRVVFRGNRLQGDITQEVTCVKTLAVAQEYEAWMFTAVVLSFLGPRAISGPLLDMACDYYGTYKEQYFPYGAHPNLIWQ